MHDVILGFHWGEIGRFLVSAAFLSSLALLFTTWKATGGEHTGGASDDASGSAATSLGQGWARLSTGLWSLKGVTLLAASAILIHLILTHQFQFYYVWNYSSMDLETKYLFSAFYGGQEGSFMLWILISTLFGFGLIRWTRPPYRWPVLFVMAFTQAFLLSMILGWDLGGLKIGASPFRTIAQEMPDAPFLRANPEFVPADGRGLNDLLKSPWMMIHPPILFVGFAMMTIPFAFAIASLWTRTYHEWVRPALPWTLAANVSLLTAIFLGGYWAYETLSFGGYWAWDPVENASLVPWLIGTAGIHTMIIQTRSARAHKASLFFAIFAYILIVYETFLTRSGVLANASVHSFVDLGLYNQLVLFMLAITVLGLGFYVARYREIPSPEKESEILSGEFLTFTGAILLLVLGLVIILGTSSPIIGRLFYENPTPPEISFYNDWSAPLAILMGLLTVIGQVVFWRPQTWDSLASALLVPLLLTSVATMTSIVFGNVRDLFVMIYLFSGWFTVFGNGAVLWDLARRNPKLIGGTLTHVGFGALLLGVMASSKYGSFLVPPIEENFNARVEAGEAFDEDGFPITTKIESFELQRNQPKVVNQTYMVTYEGYTLKDTPRPGTQVYSIRFEPLSGGDPFVLSPEVYPMMSSASNGRVDWSVDPDIRTGWRKDLYVYVGGSAYVEQKNEDLAKAAQVAGGLMDASAGGPVDGSSSGAETASSDSQSASSQTIQLTQGGSVTAGSYRFTFRDYAPAQREEIPDSTQVAIRAVLQVVHEPTGRTYEVMPLFAVFIRDGRNFTYSPPLRVEEWGLEVQFSGVAPEQNAIELSVDGLDAFIEEDWIFVTAEQKPFVSVVWLGTFLLMAGFSVSILRHWERDRDLNRRSKGKDEDGVTVPELSAAARLPIVLLTGFVGLMGLLLQPVSLSAQGNDATEARGETLAHPAQPGSQGSVETDAQVGYPLSMATKGLPGSQHLPATPREAFLKSLLVPGWGHQAVQPDSWRRGQVHLGADVAMAIGVYGVAKRERSLDSELRTLAMLKAGVSIEGRSRSFELAMADYNSLAEYNEAMLRQRFWDRLIEDVPENRWVWASQKDREDFSRTRSDLDRAGRQVPALLSLMVVNRVISALSAYSKARDLLPEPLSGSQIWIGPMEAGRLSSPAGSPFMTGHGSSAATLSLRFMF